MAQKTAFINTKFISVYFYTYLYYIMLFKLIKGGIKKKKERKIKKTKRYTFKNKVNTDKKKNYNSIKRQK